VEVNRLDPVCLQDHQEEGGEGRHHTGKDREKEDGLCRRGQGVPWRPAMPDAGGAPLAILAPDHLAHGLELTVALDMGAEQGRRRRRCSFGRSSGPGGPAWCHCPAGWGRILEEDRMQERTGCTSSIRRGGGDAL
jgi:hypothetical protein